MVPCDFLFVVVVLLVEVGRVRVSGSRAGAGAAGGPWSWCIEGREYTESQEDFCWISGRVWEGSWKG